MSPTDAEILARLRAHFAVRKEEAPIVAIRASVFLDHKEVDELLAAVERVPHRVVVLGERPSPLEVFAMQILGREIGLND